MLHIPQSTRLWSAADVINTFPRFAAVLTLALAGVWAAHAQETNQPVGYLHVEQEGVAIAIPDRDYIFKVGNTAKLFALQGNCLVVHHQVEGVAGSLFAVRWNKYDAPAWISNERLVTFGKLTPTVPGTLLLEKGENLPVESVGNEFYRATVTRFGVASVLDISKDQSGLLFETQKASTEVPVVAGGATNVQRARVTITGSGSLLSIVTNDPYAVPGSVVAPTVVPSVPVVAVPPPVDPSGVPAAADLAASPPVVAPPTTEPTPLPAHVKWPSLLEDRSNLLVIGVVLTLLAALFWVSRKRGLQAKQKASATAPAAAPAPTASSRLKVASPAGGGVSGGGDGRLRYVPSNVNQTIMLNQQHAAAASAAGTGYPAPPPQYQARPKPQGAGATAIIPSPPVLPDRRSGGVLWIGKYAVEQLLGRGRMGVVYKAHQQDLNRSVALKLLAEGGYASEKQKESFVREAQAIAKLRHPNIVTVYEVGEWESQPYFTMEFIDGKSLDKMVVKQRLAPLDAARLTYKIATAIDYAHSCGIVHRDLKPGNIIIDGKGEPIITDFGLARHMDDDPAAAGDDILGTPAYMSPEQARGRANETDARSDVYSTGAILYAMLTGRDPFMGSSLLDTLHKVIHEKPIQPEKLEPDVDIAISAICMKAMAKDTKKRYQTAAEMAADLDRYVRVLESGQTPTPSVGTGILARFFTRRA